MGDRVNKNKFDLRVTCISYIAILARWGATEILTHVNIAEKRFVHCSYHILHDHIKTTALIVAHTITLLRFV